MHFQSSNWINSCLLPVGMNWWIGDAPFFYSLMIASLALQVLPHFSMGLASSVSFLSLEVSCKALFSCNPKKKRVHAIFQWKSCTVCIKETHSVSVKGSGSAFFPSSTSLHCSDSSRLLIFLPLLLLLSSIHSLYCEAVGWKLSWCYLCGLFRWQMPHHWTENLVDCGYSSGQNQRVNCATGVAWYCYLIFAWCYAMMWELLVTMQKFKSWDEQSKYHTGHTQLTHKSHITHSQLT